jgi:D-alanyl-D-alanine carboxypeptidase/D-alanyl-D-alanine-endopeptidase (penicillin-binding protein 4)
MPSAGRRELGPRARLSTRLLATGRRDGTTWNGDLYLRGGGDVTFGTASFARRAYGSRATVERLAAALRRAGVRRIRGRVLGDATLSGDNGGSGMPIRFVPPDRVVSPAYALQDRIVRALAEYRG